MTIVTKCVVSHEPGPSCACAEGAVQQLSLLVTRGSAGTEIAQPSCYSTILPSRILHDAIAVGRRFRIVGDHEDGLADALVQIAQQAQHQAANSRVSRFPVGSSASRIAG